MQYSSTRGQGSYSFTEAMRLGRTPEGLPFVPAELPSLSWQQLLEVQSDYRALLIFSAFADDLTETERLEIMSEAYHENLYPQGLLRAGRLNEYKPEQLIIELDRGPSGSLFDHDISFHLSVMRALGVYPEKQIVIPPYPAEQAAFLAWRHNQAEPQDYPAILIHNRNCARQLPWLVEGDLCARTSLRPPQVEEELQWLAAEQSERYDLVDGSSPASFISSLIILATGLAELEQQEQWTEPVDLALPAFDLHRVLAALYLKVLGAPLNKIIIVNGHNHALADFIRTGKYSLRRRFMQSPVSEMERILPSNLEKLICELSGRSEELTEEFMHELETRRQASLSRELKQAWDSHLSSAYANERQAQKLRTELYHRTDYLADIYTLITLSAIEHSKREHSRPIIIPICGRPWLMGGSEFKRAEIEREAQESGCYIPDFYLAEKSDAKALYEDYEAVFGQCLKEEAAEPEAEEESSETEDLSIKDDSVLE